MEDDDDDGAHGMAKHEIKTTGDTEEASNNCLLHYIHQDNTFSFPFFLLSLKRKVDGMAHDWTSEIWNSFGRKLQSSILHSGNDKNVR